MFLDGVLLSWEKSQALGCSWLLHGTSDLLLSWSHISQIVSSQLFMIMMRMTMTAAVAPTLKMSMRVRRRVIKRRSLSCSIDYDILSYSFPAKDPPCVMTPIVAAPLGQRWRRTWESFLISGLATRLPISLSTA